MTVPDQDPFGQLFTDPSGSFMDIFAAFEKNVVKNKFKYY
jgi:hypothetical protein